MRKVPDVLTHVVRKGFPQRLQRRGLESAQRTNRGKTNRFASRAVQRDLGQAVNHRGAPWTAQKDAGHAHGSLRDAGIRIVNRAKRGVEASLIGDSFQCPQGSDAARRCGLPSLDEPRQPFDGAAADPRQARNSPLALNLMSDIRSAINASICRLDDDLMTTDDPDTNGRVPESPRPFW